MHRYGEASAATDRRREQRRLCTTNRSNGSDRTCIATARAARTTHCYGSATEAPEHASRRREQRRRCGEKNASRRRERPQIQATPGTEDASQCESRPDYSSLGRSNGSDRADASRRREQRILCKDTTEQRQRPRCIATASRADYASVRWSKGTNRACIAVPQAARAAQTMHRYGGATAATEHASRRREQRRLSSVRRSNGSDRACIATARAAQTMHRFCGVTAARDGESSTDCASLWRSYGNDRACIATARAAHNEDCLGF